MVKSELIERLAKRFPDLTQADAGAAVEQILRALTATLAAGGRIEIRDFGCYSVTIKPPRLGRNPRTGEAVFVPAKASPHFKAGKLMRDVVDTGKDLAPP